jgi:hypothetical protein
MAHKIEYFYIALPDRFALKLFNDRHALNVLRIASV